MPAVDLVTAGFPCQDLSQAGLTAGIKGDRSGLVAEVFRLLRRRHPRWLLLENVLFMLQLDGGKAMRFLVDELEAMNYRWAYRVVDSRFTGVAQRRRRVILLASRTEDPRTVLFADDAGEPPLNRYRDDAFGFYWTEGLRGLGWAVDATPTLKGGSTIGIPSPPAIWIPGARAGERVVVPDVEVAECLQGFDAGWTEAAVHGRRRGDRWKLVGNAVTVGVAEWLGERLSDPKDVEREHRLHDATKSWPRSAYGHKGKTYAVPELSEYPRHEPYTHLLDSARPDQLSPLSARGAAGFLGRARRGSLRFADGFLDAIAEHAELMRAGEQLTLTA